MTIGEIFSKAAVNTLLGMGIVFTVLILISGIIYLFKYIPTGEGAAAAAKTPAAAEPPSEETGESLQDDRQLAAVIMAAIMASKGVDPASAKAEECPYIVRTIKRRKG